MPIGYNRHALHDRVPSRTRVRMFRSISRALVIALAGAVTGAASVEIAYRRAPGIVLEMDRDVPHITLPVRPGRDMARLVEVAAMVQALRGMGYDPAKEFNDRLMAHLGNGAGV